QRSTATAHVPPARSPRNPRPADPALSPPDAPPGRRSALRPTAAIVTRRVRPRAGHATPRARQSPELRDEVVTQPASGSPLPASHLLTSAAATCTSVRADRA